MRREMSLGMKLWTISSRPWVHLVIASSILAPIPAFNHINPLPNPTVIPTVMRLFHSLRLITTALIHFQLTELILFFINVFPLRAFTFCSESICDSIHSLCRVRYTHAYISTVCFSSPLTSPSSKPHAVPPAEFTFPLELCLCVCVVTGTQHSSRQTEQTEGGQGQTVLKGGPHADDDIDMFLPTVCGSFQRHLAHIVSSSATKELNQANKLGCRNDQVIELMNHFRCGILLRFR